VDVTLHYRKQHPKRVGWDLWESPTHLGTATLVLGHDKVRGCFVLCSCPDKWRLSESSYYFRQSGTETVSFQGDGRQDLVTGEKKSAASV